LTTRRISRPDGIGWEKSMNESPGRFTIRAWARLYPWRGSSQRVNWPCFQAEDSFSSIEEVEYLVRPGVWRVVFPVDGICDAKQESFKFQVPLPPNADNLISIRVTDRHHNVGVFRQVF
jgi:hypothetical protein